MYLYVSVLLHYVCGHMCVDVPDAQRGQKRMSESVEPKLGVVVNHHAFKSDKVNPCKKLISDPQDVGVFCHFYLFYSSLLLSEFILYFSHFSFH